jgi:hypothetical protein
VSGKLDKKTDYIGKTINRHRWDQIGRAKRLTSFSSEVGGTK